jgi:hypothetical protein
MPAESLRSEFLCSVTGFVAPPRDVGETPRGTRRFHPAIGGSFEGPRLRGEVLPDGGDWLLLRPDGVLEQDVRITLKTDDGAFIYVRYAGMRHGPPEVMARLTQGETVDPSEYYLRVAPMFETGAERYAWLNKILAVGVARGSRLIRFGTTSSRYCRRAEGTNSWKSHGRQPAAPTMRISPRPAERLKRACVPERSGGRIAAASNF